MAIATLDPEVQKRLIDLAQHFIDTSPKPAFDNAELKIAYYSEKFDQAYKAIAKTVKEG